MTKREVGRENSDRIHDGKTGIANRDKGQRGNRDKQKDETISRGNNSIEQNRRI